MTDQGCIELIWVALRVRRIDAQRNAVGEDRYQNEIFKRSGTGSLRQRTKIGLNFKPKL